VRPALNSKKGKYEKGRRERNPRNFYEMTWPSDKQNKKKIDTIGVRNHLPTLSFTSYYPPVLIFAVSVSVTNSRKKMTILVLVTTCPI